MILLEQAKSKICRIFQIHLFDFYTKNKLFDLLRRTRVETLVDDIIIYHTD